MGYDALMNIISEQDHTAPTITCYSSAFGLDPLARTNIKRSTNYHARGCGLGTALAKMVHMTIYADSGHYGENLKQVLRSSNLEEFNSPSKNAN